MTYRIKRVAQLTGINPATLRAWERRYGLVAPGRTDSGYRLYSDEDVAMLGRIKALVDDGLTIGEAIGRMGRVGAPESPEAAGTRVHEVRFRLLEALLSYDRRGAIGAYEAVASLPPSRRVEEVLVPVMHDAGDLRERGEAGVCEERFASAFVREKLMGILEDLNTGTARGPEAVCAGVPGEPHEFGLLAAAVHLTVRGWQVLYLGPGVPLPEIRRVLHQRRPALFCTSVVSRLPAAEFRQLVRDLRAAAPPDTEVVVGGRGAVAPVAGERVRVVTELVQGLAAA